MQAFNRLFGWIFYKINRKYYWHQLLWPIGFLNLIALRVNLRLKNLHDTTRIEPPVPPIDGSGFDARQFRALDGSYNDLGTPCMGMRNTRFGRNFPTDRTVPDAAMMEPSPRTVSRRLLQRETFLPATTLNLLAAAWIQFQVHDWFGHGKNSRVKLHDVPLEDGDEWPSRPMTVSMTTPDSTTCASDDGFPPTFLCTETHWWDASQLYSGDLQLQAQIRTGQGGKLKLTEDGRLPIDREGIDLTGNNNNWWFGLSVLHTIFAHEHNHVCDLLAAEYPEWTDDRLFLTARLIIAALLAKIHTIEWTPSLLNTSQLRIGMRGNWWGLLGETIRKKIGRVLPGDIFSGILGSQTDHHGVRYSITEEFVSVYRMHPLIPDEFPMRDARTGELLGNFSLAEVASREVRPLIDKIGIPNALYHLGTAHPGALKLKNYPNGLRDLLRQDETGIRVDLATIDILRDRERGVPRYNDFRELVDMPRIKRFEDLTDDPALAEEIKAVYGGDIDKVDTLVGCLAETPPPGFAFSDTAFRIFILMASRRLKSDRFFTTDFTPRIYSKVGMDYVMNTSFTDVLRRQVPDIAAAIGDNTSPFFPWKGAVQ